MKWILIACLAFQVGIGGGEFCDEVFSVFPSLDEVREAEITTFPSSDPGGIDFREWIFPNTLQFPCSGNLTGWIFRSEPGITDFSDIVVPRLSLYEASQFNPSVFVLRNESGSADELSEIEPGLYQYTLQTPILVQQDNILGIRYDLDGPFLPVGFRDLRTVDRLLSDVSFWRPRLGAFVFGTESGIVTRDNQFQPLVTILTDSDVFTTLPAMPSTTAAIETAAMEPTSASSSVEAITTPTPTLTPQTPQPTSVGAPSATPSPTAPPIVSSPQPQPSILPSPQTTTTTTTTASSSVAVTTVTVPSTQPKTQPTSDSTTFGTTSAESKVPLAVIVGVSVSLLSVVLVTAVVVMILVLAMRRRRNKLYTVPDSDNVAPLDNPTYAVNVGHVDEDKKLSTTKKNTLPVYANLNGASNGPALNGAALNGTTHTAHHTVLAHHSGTYEGYNGSAPHPQSQGRVEPYTEVTMAGQRHQEMNSSVVYYELLPTRTEDIREPQDYALPVATSLTPVQYEEPMASLAAHLNGKVQQGNGITDHDYRVLEQGIYVPTIGERELYLSGLELAAGNSPTFDVSVYSGICQKYREQLSRQSFFLEDEVYWQPASSKTALYDQLAKKKYREILRKQIKFIKHLGSGQFGTVSKGHWEQPDSLTDVAVKMLMPRSSDEDKVKFLQEAAIMGQFSHPNVVQLYGVVTVGEPVMIILEYMERGDLRDYLRKQQPEPGEMVDNELPHLLLRFCREIAKGMDYLSSKSFVHRDLAARNVLLGADFTCKIGDFGMSRNLEDNNYYITHGGKIPVKWTAPEALNFRKYSTASDVWSFGAVMYETWSLGCKPFEGYTNSQTIELVGQGFRLPPPPGCPRALYELMIRCWHYEASRRPVFSAIVTMLSHSDSQLLIWQSKDLAVHPQVAQLGADRAVASKLYHELQDYYLDRTQ